MWKKTTWLGCLTIALLSIFSQPSEAGNWASGGGTLLRDANNPWFLGDVEEINYCITLDDQHVSASTELIDDKIRLALAYWREQFQYAAYHKYADKLRQAQQRFVRHSCPTPLETALERMDLVFQFGVLTDEQRNT